MATVHPSRMALVPQGSLDRPRGRSPRHGERVRPSSGERRLSPAYDDYRRPEPPLEITNAPLRQQENMYPNRRGGEGFYKGAPAGGSDYMESRRLQRDKSTVNVWPPSPKAPARSLSPKHRGKRSKRDRTLSTNGSSSEEERRKRDKRRRRKEKERDKDKHEKRRRRSRSRARSDDDIEERGRSHHRTRHTRSRSAERASRRIQSHRQTPQPEEDEWVVKSPVRAHSPSLHSFMPPPPIPPMSHQDYDSGGDDDEDDDNVGPQPAFKANMSKRIDERSYGGALLRGEGSAMAAFLQDGTDSRIPRRGEIGLTPDEIAKYEDVGYVMSGSRHRRMNAVRMRKENQVISAEEKRGILKLQREERERREAILREEFSELVNEKLKGTDIGPAKPT